MDLQAVLQPLPLSGWEETKIALHLFAQVIGKIKLALHPKKNHWWHVTLLLTARGLTTGPVPHKESLFQIDLDFIDHACRVYNNLGKTKSFSLSGLSVKDFYQSLMDSLAAIDVTVDIDPHPFDPSKVKSDKLFYEDEKHRYEDGDSVQRYWRILCVIYPIYQTFNGQFTGKVSPIQFFWHTLDYTLTFFSGRAVPPAGPQDSVSKEAYSHEVISFGFWPGDDNLPEPAFYSYTFPEPSELAKQALAPSEAVWIPVNSTHLAVYHYHDWIKAADKKEALLSFLNSCYQAGSTLGKWPKEYGAGS